MVFSYAAKADSSEGKVIACQVDYRIVDTAAPERNFI